MGAPYLSSLASQTVVVNNNIKTRFRTIKHLTEFFITIFFYDSNTQNLSICHVTLKQGSISCHVYKPFTDKQTKTKTHSKTHCLLLGAQHCALGSSYGSSMLSGREISTPRRLLTVFAVRAHCLVMVSMVPNKSFSAEFHSSHLATWYQKPCASSPFLHETPP